MRRVNTRLARGLRKNQTDAERKLWSLLRRKQLNGIKFKRQFPLGPYIVDFYASGCRLAVEVDGGGHYGPECADQDKKRTVELENLGVKVLRFSNIEVLLEIDAVSRSIEMELAEMEGKKETPSP